MFHRLSFRLRQFGCKLDKCMRSMGSRLNVIHASNAENTEVLNTEGTVLIIDWGHSQVIFFSVRRPF